MKSKKSDFVVSRSVCTRCGKPRIVIDTYQEKIETSTVTYTITSCPDLECQKIVDGKLKEEETRRGVIKDEQERREIIRKQNILQKKQAHMA